jgi:hypothetical protein
MVKVIDQFYAKIDSIYEIFISDLSEETKFIVLNALGYTYFVDEAGKRVYTIPLSLDCSHVKCDKKRTTIMYSIADRISLEFEGKNKVIQLENDKIILDFYMWIPDQY